MLVVSSNQTISTLSCRRYNGDDYVLSHMFQRDKPIETAGGLLAVIAITMQLYHRCSVDCVSTVVFFVDEICQMIDLSTGNKGLKSSLSISVIPGWGNIGRKLEISIVSTRFKARFHSPRQTNA